MPRTDEFGFPIHEALTSRRPFWMWEHLVEAHMRELGCHVKPSREETQWRYESDEMMTPIECAQRILGERERQRGRF